jgi:hypothetical protein
MKPSLPQFARLAMVTLAALMLASCASKSKRVSPPSASIQQLTVKANGDWEVDLRLHNYSAVSMRFDSARIEISVDEHVAGSVDVRPGISIGPSSADVVSASLKPSAMARIAVADALASRRSLAYRLQGQVSATPDESSKARQFEVDDRSQLNPAPGLDGVLR